ncbi:immunoglobulin lambda-like polypeptide 1 [Sebastes umbrosus]|uniref:immunoglobulin lambda-like polypeptide 1 n=1 Tax=Sebastes umbrosus TaxID=72105 RepID=UPI0018A0C56F|nr:immunoglobulin lambda-like polypeptide 1 [Sebastes umbrosus]
MLIEKQRVFSVDRCLFTVQEVFVRPLNEFVSLWRTFGGGTKLIINSGTMVRPSVSLLPPSSEQLSGGSATLACLLTGYSPQGAVVSWQVDGTEVTEGGPEQLRGGEERPATAAAAP